MLRGSLFGTDDKLACDAEVSPFHKAYIYISPDLHNDARINFNNKLPRTSA